MTEVERAAGELVDVTIELGQLLIPPIRRSPSDDAAALKAQLYAMLPLTAAVTLWNTAILIAPYGICAAAVSKCQTNCSPHVAPLGWEHIGLTGDYLRSEMDKPRERFRTLRPHQTGREA